MIAEFGRRSYAALDAGADVRPMISPTLRVRVGSGPELDGETWLAIIARFRAGFADGGHVFDEWIVADGRLVTRGWYQGTHTGEFAGVAPTGVTVRVGVLHVDHVEHGVLTEHHGQLDMAGMLDQLRAGAR